MSTQNVVPFQTRSLLEQAALRSFARPLDTLVRHLPRQGQVVVAERRRIPGRGISSKPFAFRVAGAGEAALAVLYTID